MVPEDSSLWSGSGPRQVSAESVHDQDETIGPSEHTSVVQPGGASPKMLGDYELLAEIARGGMGIVYKARQRD